jgi:hypothetical protein
MAEIETGTTGMGLRWAREGKWRVTAYHDGGYAVWQYSSTASCWIIGTARQDIPADVLARLCKALGIRPAGSEE